MRGRLSGTQLHEGVTHVEMSEYKYTADSQVIQSIERVRQKIVRFRGVVEDTTAARRDHKRRCRLEKDKELEALARIMVGCMPMLGCHV